MWLRAVDLAVFEKLLGVDVCEWRAMTNDTNLPGGLYLKLTPALVELVDDLLRDGHFI